GGRGYCRNVTIKNVFMDGTNHPVYLQSDLTYTASQAGLHENTGTFIWTDIHLENFTGTAAGDRIIELDCSSAAPCYNWTFSDINIKPNSTANSNINYVCNNFVLDGSGGLDMCHPDNSTLQAAEAF
ncbi:MAG: hypothetical protein TREMPRED_001222, partial [Tremellales sp. Tagirdzhanova-0007]